MVLNIIDWFSRISLELLVCLLTKSRIKQIKIDEIQRCWILGNRIHFAHHTEQQSWILIVIT